MKKFIRDNLKKIIFFSILLVAIIIAVSITVSKQNEKNKNTVIFVLDDLYYNNVYKNDEKNIKKVLKKHYARPVVITYSLNRFSYDELERRIKTEEEATCPTHIIFSPISALNLYKSNTVSSIGSSSRSRARLISLSKIERTEIFDVAYKESKKDLYKTLASLIDSQDENTAFIYGLSSEKDPIMEIEEIRSGVKKDVFYLDEGLREKGEREANELYSLLSEKDIKVIATLGFKNLDKLSDIFESENKDVFFILPETLSSTVKPVQLGATIGVDFASALDSILTEVEITERDSLGDNTLPLKVNIKNKAIKPIINMDEEEV